MKGKTRFIFINGDYQNEATEIEKLIHDFKCSKPKDMFFSDPANRVRYLKEDPEGVEEVCKAMDEILKDDEKRIDMKKDVLHIRDMVTGLGISVEKAMDVIHIPVERRSVVVQLVRSNYYR